MNPVINTLVVRAESLRRDIEIVGTLYRTTKSERTRPTFEEWNELASLLEQCRAEMADFPYRPAETQLGGAL
ncbi:MAG: hypothetical protein AB7S38_28745 [Vulcanimicrobiota bacterium]